MNLALHGFLLQVLLSIFNLQHGSLLCSAGEPGYLDFDNLPETNFSCQGKVIGGYYADVEAGCQMFHVCTIGQKDEIMDIKFLCLNGTVFDQETRVCERVDEVDCSKSERFYNLNLELYGNNAVTLSLHENNEDDVDSPDQLDDRQRTTSARPTTTTTTTTTTSKPNKPSTTPSSSSFSHPTGYPQHFQPQPPFPQVHTSQSKSLYDDKNGGYHHQYIFHNGERSNNQQATSYQLFSNQGVSSTTVQTPQVHQIRFSSTSGPQIIHNEPSTVSPLFHATSSTIQTLLNSNVNSPALINPIFHNHGIASTTEQFSIHSNNPRETSEYRDNGEQNIRPLDAVQSTNKGKVSKLTISPVPTPEPSRSVQTKTSSQSSQQPRISGNFLSTPSTDETTVRSFYPTPRSSSKSPQSSQSTSEQVTQHIHVLPPVQIPQLKPHQITINLPPPDLQRIVQNPSSLLPSQSRVIVTAKASVSDESGRPLNTTQLVTLPLPTIPASYDDYKEGDESFDPFYRDVPKIRNNRGARRSSSEARTGLRPKRSVGQTKSSMVSFVYGGDTKKKQDGQIKGGKKDRNRDKVNVEEGNKEFKSIKESLMKFRDILFGGEFTEDTIRSVFEGSRLQLTDPDGKVRSLRRDSLEDLETKASKNFKTREYDDETEEEALKKESDAEEQSEGLEIPLQLDTKASDAEEYIDIDDGKEAVSDSKDDAEEFGEIERGEGEEEEEEEEGKGGEEEEEEDDVKKEDIEESKPDLKVDNEEKPRDPERDIDVVILDPNEYLRMKSAGQESLSSTTEEEEIVTEIPILSTTEETTEATIVSHPEDKQDLNVSKNQDDTIEESKQPKKTESDQEKPVEEERKEKPKEQNPRRKSSRIRSSRGKISSRKKETKNKEPVKPLEEKVPEQKVETTTEPVVISEVEQIDKHIFDEPESQTSKEVDTRAVGNHSGYVKSHQTGKDQDSGKENRKGEANEYEILKKQAETLEKDEEKIDKLLEDNEETTIPTLDEEQIEEEERIEVAEEPEVTEKVEHPETSKENVSVEEKTYYKEESSIEHENVEDESTTVFSNDDSQEDSHEVVKSSRKEKSMKFEDSSREVSSHRQDKSRKIDDEEEEERESQEYSTIKSEEFNSQELYDSTESFYENTDELDTEDDYGSAEDATVSSEHSASEEVPSSREESTEEHNENESTLSDQEVSTEGVLKFTDELPKDKKEDVSENKKPSESVENIAHDYVDDNYEPDNYKEQESSDSNNLSDEKTNKEMLSDGKMENIGVETTTEPEKSPDEETESPYDFSTDQMDLLQTTTSTTTTSTTTARPTPLKLFKPIAARKNYNYIPPTTTPNPVVIKPRLSLLNPKPAKPPKSYNELAPKPVIRKFTLLARKQTTTMATTRYREEDSTETTEMTTTESPLTTTETSRSEENVLEGKLEKDQILVKGKDDQDSSPSEQKSPTNVKKEEDEGFTPYPITRLTTLASTIEKTLKEVESTSVEPEKQVTPKNFTLLDIEIVSTTALSTFNETDNVEEPSSTTMKPATEEETSIAPTTKRIEDVTEYPSTSLAFETTIVAETTSKEAEEIVSTTMRSLRRKSATLRRQDGFNCLEKEMYRFYGDNRDCRLFHYCSPGFTSRQVLDFRFVCEEGTAFDEESQSCSHDGRSGGCLKRQW